MERDDSRIVADIVAVSRASDRDFGELQSFLASYSLLGTYSNADARAELRVAHRRYLAFLQLWSICSSAIGTGPMPFFSLSTSARDAGFAHFRESISDVGSGLFCALHGAYKPAHMSTRSSIENFVRFSAGTFEPRALTTTSVYELFEIAKHTEPYSGGQATQLQSLKQSYAELCLYTHTASLEHMAGIHALAHFPSFEVSEFRKWIELTTTCMRAIVVTVLSSNPPHYLTAHFDAQELMDALLTTDFRVKLLAGEVLH